MPKKDGTGPMGMGPLTGKGIGNCAGYASNQFTDRAYGCGRRTGRGGRGFRGMACYTGTTGRHDLDEKSQLKNQESFLEKQLQSIKERLKGLDDMSV